MTKTRTNTSNDDDLFVGLNEANKAFCVRLRANDPTIRDLFLASVRSFEEEYQYINALGKCLAINTHLRVLCIDILELNIPLAHALANGIRQSKLEQITFRWPILDGSRSLKIRRILHRAIQTSPTIRSISWNNIFDANDLIGIGDILSSLHTLEDLSITTSDVIAATVHGDQIAQLLAETLPRSTTITTLRLDLKPLTNVGTAQLIQGLFCNSSITNLELSDCMGDSGALLRMLLAEGENLHPTLLSRLRRFGLRQTDFTMEGVQLLMHAVIQNRFPVLQELDLSYTRNVDFAALQVLGEALVDLPPRLERIDISGCRPLEFQLADLSESDKTGRDPAAHALLHGIQQNCLVKELNMECVPSFPPNVKNEMDYYLRLNRNGRYLLSQHHGLSPTIWCHILSKMKQDPLSCSCIFYFLTEMPTLVQPRGTVPFTEM